MVKIRLKRTGTKKRPCYRLVVADARSPRDGKFIEAVGFYDPLPTPAVIRVDAERVQYWLGNGARPSDSARMLLEHEGILPKTVRVQVPSKKTAAAESASSTSRPAGATTRDGREAVVTEEEPVAEETLAEETLADDSAADEPVAVAAAEGQTSD